MTLEVRADELAELVSGLLVKPEFLGELDLLETYESFLRDIAQVVHNHCGGERVSAEVHENELAPLITALLLRPELFGELDTLETYESFLRDIAQVVCDYCGGEVVGVATAAAVVSADASKGSRGANCSSVLIGANDSLPSLEDNVWTKHASGGF